MMLLDEKEMKIVGDITMFNDGVRKNEGAKRETLKEMKTEQDRIDALKEIFNIELTEEESKGISGDLKL